MISLNPIGYIHNGCLESQTPELIKQEITQIEILPEYAAGLQQIEEQSYLDLIFILHRESVSELITRIRSGEKRGIFSTRSPRRPNHIGVTTVQLLWRNENVLWVKGADALEGSPVVDIKCCDTSLFHEQEIHQHLQMAFPRADLIRHILSGNLSELLFQAARLHGHICPGLALGVMSAVEVIRELLESGETPQDYQLTIEMQHCPVDGILWITGCTPGGNRFVLGDPNKDSFTLKNQKGTGWKVDFLPSCPSYMDLQLPANLSSLERGMQVFNLDKNQMFQIQRL